MTDHLSGISRPCPNDVKDYLEFVYGRKSRLQVTQFSDGSLAHYVLRQVSSIPCANILSVLVSRSIPEVTSHYNKGGVATPVICLSHDHLICYLKLRGLFELQLDVLMRAVEYVLYKLIAELAIKYARLDFAVLIFIKAFRDYNPTFTPDAERYTDASPFDDEYGLIGLLDYLHELGHDPRYQQQCHPPFDVTAAIRDAIEKSPWDVKIRVESALTPSKLLRFFKPVRTMKISSEDMFKLASLTEEIIADMYGLAGFVSYLSLADRRTAPKSFLADSSFDGCLREYAIYHVIVGLMLRCRVVAQLLSEKLDSSDILHMSELQNAFLQVRRRFLFRLLRDTLVEYAGSPYSGDAHRRHVEDELGGIEANVLVKSMHINVLLRQRVVKSCIEVARREPDLSQVEGFRQKQGRNIRVRIELEEFCEKADSFGKDSRLLQCLKSILQNPDRSLG